jgi:benzil reductase ((S)-benzoin forming)
VQKVAIITGTGGGIGKATAELLLKEGYLVYGYSRTNKIQHPNFTFTKIDLSNLDAVKQLQFPKESQQDILLINNAATILVAPTILCKKFITTYSEDKKLLINIGSGAGNSPIHSWSTYCTTKAAIDMLTGVIAEENHKNLTVFSVHPGVVDTNMQSEIRNSNPKNFPLLSKFTDYYVQDKLESTKIVAQKLFHIIQNSKKFKHNILLIRDVSLN